MTSLTKGRLELFLFSSCLSSFSMSTQQINFHHAHRRQCSKAGLPNVPWAELQSRRPNCMHRQVPSAPSTTHLLHELWLAHPPIVCVTFNKIIPPGGLVDATNHQSSHAFTLRCVCGSSSVSVLGCWGGPDSSYQRTHEQMQLSPMAWTEQLEFQV